MVEGIGEKVTLVPVMPGRSYCGHPGEGVPTSGRYALLDRTYGNFRKRQPSGTIKDDSGNLGRRHCTVSGWMYNILKTV